LICVLSSPGSREERVGGGAIWGSEGGGGRGERGVGTG
jgi:hypothetical protein